MRTAQERQERNVGFGLPAERDAGAMTMSALREAR
jgi:hypothetical protein